MEKKLEQLLLEKKFGELTAEEKYYVTESIGETEYNRLHILLNKSKTALKNTPSLNPELKNNLLKKFREEHGLQPEKKPTAIVRVLRYRIPAWQAAAAVALLLGFHFWQQEEPEIIKETDTVYVHKTDTIYKEVALPTPAVKKPMTKPPSRVNVKPLPNTVQSEPTIIAAADSVSRRHKLSELPDTFNMTISQPRGQSVAQSEGLWELLGEVY